MAGILPTHERQYHDHRDSPQCGRATVRAFRRLRESGPLRGRSRCARDPETEGRGAGSGFALRMGGVAARSGRQPDHWLRQGHGSPGQHGCGGYRAGRGRKHPGSRLLVEQWLGGMLVTDSNPWKGSTRTMGMGTTINTTATEGTAMATVLLPMRSRSARSATANTATVSRAVRWPRWPGAGLPRDRRGWGGGTVAVPRGNESFEGILYGGIIATVLDSAMSMPCSPMASAPHGFAEAPLPGSGGRWALFTVRAELEQSHPRFTNCTPH
jgi:hypothetical protein